MLSLIALSLSLLLDLTWLTHTDELAQYTIAYPETWEKTMTEGYVTFLTAAKDSNDTFRENVNVLIQDLTQQPTSMEQYTQITKDWILETGGPEGLISETNIQLSGLPAKEVMYKLPATAFDFTEPLLFYQVWIITPEKAFLLTYSGTIAEFDIHLENAKKTIHSFKLNKP
ncbi:MAG TPA: hypothetical protein VFH43_13030 [Candidatus Kapabacteria bacterium]|nr:hypothetical protein [Candidatus Kapabacteria bacterium]